MTTSLAFTAPASASFTLGVARHVASRYERRDWHGQAHVAPCRWSSRDHRQAQCNVTLDRTLWIDVTPEQFQWTDLVSRFGNCWGPTRWNYAQGSYGPTVHYCYTGPLQVVTINLDNRT